MIEGVLLGTAVGDALGLPMEGLSAGVIEKRFRHLDRYQLFLGRGWVSDDTEQSALVAQSLVVGRGELEPTVRAFRRSMVGWFLRLPWGIGWATLRACVKLTFGVRRSAVRSAGNGGAMRAAILGAVFRGDPRHDASRALLVRAITEVTHDDERAVQGAQFVADVVAARGSAGARLKEARTRMTEPSLGRAVDEALAQAERASRAEQKDARGEPTPATQPAFETSGFVLHTVAFAAYVFARFGDEGARRCLTEVMAAGGDTDSIGAIVGAWCGALHGRGGFDPLWIERLQRGPFGLTHLTALARDLTAVRDGVTVVRPARFFWPAAMLRNLALYPIVLAHGLRRLLPPYW